MCKEESWEEVVEEVFEDREGSWPWQNFKWDGDDMVVEVMLQVMSESCLADWRRSLLVSLHKDGNHEEVGNFLRL